MHDRTSVHPLTADVVVVVEISRNSFPWITVLLPIPATYTHYSIAGARDTERANTYESIQSLRTYCAAAASLAMDSS